MTDRKTSTDERNMAHGILSYVSDLLKQAQEQGAIFSGEKIDYLNREARAAVDGLYERTITDPLTGLATRAYLGEQATKSMSAFTHNRSAPYSVAVLRGDLDNFKQANDTLGHDGGDKVLRAVGYVMNSSFYRQGDTIGTIGREGGDEFVGILPETDLDGAITVAKRIQERGDRFKTRYMGIFGDRLNDAERAAIDDVTISLGVAATDTMIPYTTLKDYADRAAYYVKDNGKNGIAKRLPDGNFSLIE